MWIKWSDTMFWHSRTGQVLKYVSDLKVNYDKKGAPHVCLFENGDCWHYQRVEDKDAAKEFMKAFIRETRLAG